MTGTAAFRAVQTYFHHYSYGSASENLKFLPQNLVLFQNSHWWRQHALISCRENFEIITMRKKVNTMRQKINIENSHRPDIFTECLILVETAVLISFSVLISIYPLIWVIISVRKYEKVFIFSH